MAAAKKRRRRPSGGEVLPDPYAVREPEVRTFSTGCTVLDLALGGGWAVGRVANVVGDRSTGKTLLAIEAAANFARENPGAKVIYYEAEAAFDRGYAETLGLPRDRIEFPPDVDTVEDLYEDVDRRFPKGKKHRTPTLIVVDSLDALTDRAEDGRAIDQGTFGAGKAKQLSALFRRLIRRLAAAGATTIIVSQVRDRIGVTFGERHSRSGGHALDFYATHALWLAHLGRIKRKVGGVERAVGVLIRGSVKKCKIGQPFHQAEFPLLFGYGVDDLAACLGYLVEVKRTKLLGFTPEQAQALAAKSGRLSVEDHAVELENARAAVRKVWAELEAAFRPARRKYE